MSSSDLHPESRETLGWGQLVWKRFLSNRIAVVGGVLMGVFLIVAVLAPWVAPHDPLKQDLYGRLATPTLEHPFGTDDFGRDILSRVIYGTRISLRIGVVCVLIALVIGTVIGLVAGFYGGVADQVLMRFMDLMLAFPSILLAIGIVAVLGPGLENAMIAIGVVAIPQYARLIRASTLSVREADYVQALRALGANDARILRTAILPNCLAPLIVQATLGLATAILEGARHDGGAERRSCGLP